MFARLKPTKLAATGCVIATLAFRAVQIGPARIVYIRILNRVQPIRPCQHWKHDCVS